MHEVKDFCDCCGNPVEAEKLPLTCDPIELSHLGESYPLYFQFIKYCIGLLILMLVVNGIYNIASNAAGGYCDSSGNPSLSDKQGY